MPLGGRNPRSGVGLLSVRGSRGCSSVHTLRDADFNVLSAEKRIYEEIHHDSVSLGVGCGFAIAHTQFLPRPVVMEDDVVVGSGIAGDIMRRGQLPRRSRNAYMTVGRTYAC